MNRIYILIMTLALLVVGTTTNAQTGSLDGNGMTFRYAISGGRLISKTQGKAGPKQIVYVMEAKAGTTVSLACSREFSKDSNAPCYVYAEASTSKNGTSSGDRLLDDRVDGESANYSYRIPENAGTVELHGRCSDGTKTPCAVFVTWHVVDELTPEETSQEKPQVKKDRCEHKECDVHFRDLTGDVSYRCNDGDDDDYESAEFDVELRYEDRIRTGIDSEAILGLADRTSFRIGEKTTLLLPKQEEFSNIKMIAGVIWVNFQKMMKDGELRIGGSEAVAGLRGTIVGMEETGSETRIWLFAGAVDVTSKKTNKTVSIQAGQMTITGKNGNTTVKPFDIEEGARKFKIPMDDIRNHYSKAGGKSTSNTNRQTTGPSGNIGLKFTENRLNYKILGDNTVEVTGELKGIYSGHVAIPKLVTHEGETYEVIGIGKNAFSDQTKMISVSIPISIQYIEEDAFKNTGISTLTIPGNDVIVKRHAFRDCLKLTTANIRGRNAEVDPDAFSGCDNLRSQQGNIAPSRSTMPNRSNQQQTRPVTLPSKPKTRSSYFQNR